MINNKIFRTSFSVLMLVSSLSLTACGSRVKAGANVPTPTKTPDNFYTPQQEETLMDLSAQNSAPVINAVPNVQAGTFLADQSIVNDWQAKGIAVVGGSIYLSVSDSKGLSKKGSVVKMNSSDGKSWSDLGGSLGGLRHPMDATVEGLAVSGSTVIAVDSASKVYTLDASKGGVKVLKVAGGKDVAAGAGSFFIANGMVEKSDASASARTAINGMSATGGVGADSLGNVYAVSGVTIKKADSTGQVQDVITSDLTGPLDVAVDTRNGDIYVLEATMVKRFNTNGQLLTSFANGAIKASTIAVDETGSVYVADTGTTNKDSKVIKFNDSVDAAPTMSSASTSGYNYGSSASGNDYSTYSNTKTDAAKRR